MMTLDECLDQIENKILDDQTFLYDLIAKGHRLSEPPPPAIKRIREEVREQFANSPFSNRELKKRIDDVFLVLVTAEGFRLSAGILSNTLHTQSHISEDEAICLWLGTFGEGLWQIYADCQAMAGATAPTFPTILTRIFGSLEIGAQDEDHDLILDPLARELACFDREIDGQDIFQRLLQEFWQKQRKEVNQALQSIGKSDIQADDTPKLIAWVLDTKQARTDADKAARELDRTTLRVYKCLRMGYNTLLREYLKDIYQVIDSVK